VLLFDEIEKAHRRIFDVLLPVFDEGRLKDARGREVSFRNCIIIMTSNVGAAHVSRNETKESRGRLMDELRRHFRPEFINRIDEIVPFHPLLFEDIRTILSLSIREVARRLKEKGIRVHIYQGAYEYLAQQGYSAEFGARELRRTVDRLVVTPVSDMIVKQEFQSGDIIDVLMEGGKLVVRKGLPREDKQSQQP
jgi:ATP-dependent Clp protease ATP-binding subunit ClpA